MRWEEELLLRGVKTDLNSHLTQLLSDDFESFRSVTFPAGRSDLSLRETVRFHSSGCWMICGI